MRIVRVVEKKKGEKTMHRVIEQPNKEQQAKHEYINLGKTDATVRRKYASNLEKYHAKDIISKDQYDAGTRLYMDAYHGMVLSGLKGIDPTKATMPRQKGYKPSELTQSQAYAHKRWSEAFHSDRLGEAERDILWCVCILDMGLKEVSDNTAYASGTLRVALNELVRFYRG
jgi:hypothetical protein